MKLPLKFILFATFMANTHSIEKMVYGEDNRQEAPPYLKISRAIFAQIPKTRIDLETLEFKNFEDLKERHNLCDAQRFEKEKSLVECSAFLVDSDLIMTAGHCLDLNSKSIKQNCEDHFWVVDHFKNEDLKEKSIFKCKSVEFIRADYEEESDYALIRLDRSAHGRIPFELSLETPSKTDELAALGFPLGASMKLSNKGKFLSLKRKAMTYSLDVFGGNSGSPVINLETNKVVAVHIQGPAYSLSYDKEKACYFQAQCNLEESYCEGSVGFPVSKMSKYMFKSQFSNSNRDLYSN